jgi:hypothetical protein
MLAVENKGRSMVTQSSHYTYDPVNEHYGFHKMSAGCTGP